MLETTGIKKQQCQQMLHMRKGTRMDVGDKVWLSFPAQRLHVSHKHGEPVNEGPFDIVEKVDYETFKVLLGDSICTIFPLCDLVPCFEDHT